MSTPYLEVTYRRGRPIAAYYYMPRRPGQKSMRTRQIEPGLLADFGLRRYGRLTHLCSARADHVRNTITISVV